ncbi:glycosyltransferase [Chryseobacterium sp. RG1]|uniref:Glycosyltransferase n=1 Tax=Chryseobacterium tagetis TaxID=2801334 RepID=A0ABS8A869_9FLAO|nr:glycosyltransferase [Chryseobacterium tagetis]MCA6069135.1 glycosyltransferase [Chryseobacterium tagetis]
MKIALVQDWLTELGGAEKVFSQIFKMYPEADIYTLVCDKKILKKLEIPDSKVTTSFIQRLPFAKKKYRNYFPLFTLAIETFDLSSYDIIISSSYCVAKGVLTNSNQIHFCYCHSPVRYAWDLHFQYLREAKLESGIKGFIAKYFLHKLRLWDIASLNRVDHFISNSKFIKQRISKIYNRESITIYPPVDIDNFSIKEDKEDYYFTCSRMVPYKKVDLIVETFSQYLQDKKLIVIGTGPDFEKIKKKAGENVILMGYQPLEIMRDYMAKAKAFVFAAEEDFGIVPVEAQSCGTPVIAYGKGGVLETVLENKTGVFFKHQDALSLKDAVENFENNLQNFNPLFIRQHAEKFSNNVFINSLDSFIKEKI